MSTKEIKIGAFQERIILNVGGIKYETFRSTLIAYPETYLGTMFADRNRELLHSTKENEYFIDRDGELFRFILQFYRTGKIHFPLENNKYSKEEIYEEMDFFQIPIVFSNHDCEKEEGKVTISLSQKVQKALAKKLDEFINSLIQCINEAMEYFETKFSLKFYRFYQPEHDDWDKKEKKYPYIKFMRSFDRVGYDILERFNKEIITYLQKEIGTELSWTINKNVNSGYYKIDITIPKDFYDVKDILNFSQLLENN
ncbi:BTB/POZ protein [Glomus cerebriforme]|uniref:BTB/POZ protein n=1 Tax=Glomus cerebriforme TaxID=658196 RepID=A0A397T4J0_9GLOM|nr:BTB/POZ protein [Glomus cerebriforme]